MAAKKVGPFMVDDEREFTLPDLRKIGAWTSDDGKRVFVDYSGTDKEWYEYELRNVPDVEGGYTTSDETKTRRSVLKAMVTRRDNKRRLAARKAAV